MPYQWIDPELFLEFAGVTIYHCYEDEGPVSYYWYTTDPRDDNRVWGHPDSAQFDVRTLPDLGLDVKDFETHVAIIQHAIQAGLISGNRDETDAPSPLTVKIEVRDGIAYVVEQSAGVTVEIIGLQVKNEVPQPDTSVEMTAKRSESPILSLRQFSDRLAYVVTDLNGLISSIVNEDITIADFDDNLTDLTYKLMKVEATVQDLTNLFWS